MKRLSYGRLQVYIEPRDIWVGCYVATDAVYVCPLPLVVLRWKRGMKLAPDGRPASMFRRVDFEMDNDPRSLRAVGGEPLNVDLKDGKPVRRAERQPKRGGSGSPPIKQEVEER